MAYLARDYAPTPEQELASATPYAPVVPAAQGTLAGVGRGLLDLAQVLSGQRAELARAQQREADRQLQQERLAIARSQLGLAQQAAERRAAELEAARKARQAAQKQHAQLVRGLLALDPHSLTSDDVLTRGMETLRAFHEFAPNFKDQREQENAYRRLMNTPLMQRYQHLRANQQRELMANTQSGRTIRTKAVDLWGRARGALQALRVYRNELAQIPDDPAYDAERRAWSAKIAKAEGDFRSSISQLEGYMLDDQLSQYVPSSVKQGYQELSNLLQGNTGQPQQAEPTPTVSDETIAHFPLDPQAYRRVVGNNVGETLVVVTDPQTGGEFYISPDEYEALKQRYTHLPKLSRLPWGR